VKLSRLCNKEMLAVCCSSMLVLSGCLATQDWVNEQLFPINKRVSDNEAAVTKVDNRVTTVDGRVDTMAKQIADLENRLSQTNAKADRALESLQRLRPERKMVLNFTGGAQFPTNSIEFSGQAKKDIDSFVSDLKGEVNDGNVVLVVAGHADNTGSERFNYDLSKRRAESIAAYLTAQKKIDPARIIVVGYGESAPVADNQSESGRAKNRRVEIMAYRDSIGVGEPSAASAALRGPAKTP
jgi:outer membrane protein OmpA-like peptidoglycan-associated protein